VRPCSYNQKISRWNDDMIYHLKETINIIVNRKYRNTIWWWDGVHLLHQHTSKARHAKQLLFSHVGWICWMYQPGIKMTFSATFQSSGDSLARSDNMHNGVMQSTKCGYDKICYQYYNIQYDTMYPAITNNSTHRALHSLFTRHAKLVNSKQLAKWIHKSKPHLSRGQG